MSINNSGGWIGLLTFLDITIDKMFAALKFTSQKSAKSLLYKSPLSIVARVCSVLNIQTCITSKVANRYTNILSIHYANI